MLIDRLKEHAIRSSQRASPESLLSQQEIDRLDLIFSTLATGNLIFRPSKYWEELNRMNVEQLKAWGYENFKRTAALNYFTFVRLLPWDAQIRFLLRNLPLHETLVCVGRGIASRRHQTLNIIESLSYNLLTHALWAYVSRCELAPQLLALEEPLEGNPPLIYDEKRRPKSQDLINSILEFDSVTKGIGDERRIRSILEIGAGYGRSAYVFCKMLPEVKYLIVDIPPALWVSERYLRSIFPDRQAFAFRPFERFEEIAEEFEQSSLAFFLPSQIELLPNRIADLVLNISSLHEMKQNQINFYMAQIDRLLTDRGYFYTKQWKVSKHLFADITIREQDYPIPAGWVTVFHRNARVQAKFFEALYQMTGN